MVINFNRTFEQSYNILKFKYLRYRLENFKTFYKIWAV